MSPLSRRLHRMAWALLGAAIVVGAEVVWIYGVGVTVSVPQGEVLALARGAITRLRPSWPRMREVALERLRPVIEDEVAQIVGQITIEIGGLKLPLPPNLKAQLTGDLTQLVFRELKQRVIPKVGLDEVLTPQLMRLALSQPLRVVLRVRTGPLTVPVTINMVPSSP
ncbi:MAG: hypothetical protein OWU33_05035 [Firmicutes bacterium]|nr:hypothetical protein [Bacillota bacterium]